jgi:CubicO group peptidase (beta-lactamase class C family)
MLAALLFLAAAPPPSLDDLFAGLAGPRTPGLAVAVRRDGREIFRKGYGARDLRSYRPIGPRSNFRLASFTKQFTAAAVMLLVRDGKLRYDDTLPALFPGFPGCKSQITVRQLLTHTSGLPDYKDLMDSRWTAERQIQDFEVLELLKGQSHGKFAPGASWAYSNSAYVLLGLAVAKASGLPFDEFLSRRIFQPLGMSRTLAYVRGRNTVPERVYGHSLRGGQLVETDQSPTSATLGDGGIYSNLEDLAKWDDALTKGALLRPHELELAWTPVQLADGSEPRWPSEPGGDNLNPGQPVAYGFGWFLTPLNGMPRRWHSGSTSGFRTVIERFPQTGLSIIILCNRTDLDPDRLAQQVLEQLH